MNASPLVFLYPEKLTYDWTSFRGAGHGPTRDVGIAQGIYREAPAATLDAISGFANRLLREHHEGDIAAE